MNTVEQKNTYRLSPSLVQQKLWHYKTFIDDVKVWRISNPENEVCLAVISRYRYCNTINREINALLQKIPNSNIPSESILRDLTDLSKEIELLKEELFPVYQITIKEERRIKYKKRKEDEYNLQKLLEREQKRKQVRRERAKRRQELIKKKEDKKSLDKLRWIEKHSPTWDAIFEEIQSFIDANSNGSLLRDLSISKLQKIKDECNHKFVLLSSIKSDVETCDEYAYEFVIRYNNIHNHLNELSLLISHTISHGEKSSRQLKREKIQNRSLIDKRFFSKMIKLLDDKLGKSWYENDSRYILVNPTESILEYLLAYGRTVLGGINSAEIVTIGNEDKDEWGYIVLTDQYLPYCIREIKLVGNKLLYHFYTFTKQTDIESFDYDDAITERVIFLDSKGVK